MWRLYGLLVRFVAPCCGFRVANGVVGLIKPACSWKIGIGRHYGGKTDRNIGPRSMSVVLWTAWSHCSLRLSSPNLMFVVCSVLARTLVRFCTVGLLLVLTMSEWLASAVNVVHSTAVSPGGGWSMVLCYFVRIAVTVGGCGTRPCVKLILLSPSSLSVVLTLACAFLPWSSGKFALGDRMPMCRQAFPGSKVVVLVLLQGDGRQNIAGDSCRRKDLSIIFVFRMNPPPLMLHRLTDQVIFTPYMHFLFGCVLLLLACMVPLICMPLAIHTCWLLGVVPSMLLLIGNFWKESGHQAVAPLPSSLPLVLSRVRAERRWPRVNAALRARALPPVSGVTCRVPQCLLPVVKQSVRFAVSICSMPWNDHERAWALSRVRFVISAPSKFKDQWNAPKISKSFQVSSVASNFSIKDDIVGMHRVDKVWDLPVRLSQPESVHLAAECAATCCSALGICDVDASIAAASCARGLASCPEYNKERRRCIASDTEYQLYTSNMFRGKNEVLVPDDKLKKYMWLIPLWAYQHLLWHFALVARTWHLSCLSVACANTWCWNVLNCLLNERLKKFLHFHKYKHVLPYMYGTIKSKCFVGGVHSCCKVGHSCIRKIVSCAAWPCRKRWKYIHKALETVVRSVIMSDEIWGLKDVCIVMQSRIAKASIGSTRLNVCGRCSCCKPPVVAFSADAGQFFETVSPSAAVRVTKKVLERAAEISGRNSVTVLRGPKRQAFIGGSVARVDPSSYCFLFSDLLLAFAACMFVGFCRLGDICFRMDGLPIGGLLSKIAASIFLGCEEESWSHNVAWRRQNGFTATSPSWDKEVARGRYVDDIFWVSAVYCKPCLLRALQLIYSVEFDLASEGPVVDWLDIAFHVPNLKWSMMQKAWVFPPYWAAPRGFLRSFLCGRFHRWYEIILDDVAWFDAVAHVLSCLHQQSWPASTVRAAIFQSRHVLKPRHQRWLLRCFRGIWLPRNAKAQY